MSQLSYSPEDDMIPIMVVGPDESLVTVTSKSGHGYGSSTLVNFSNNQTTQSFHSPNYSDHLSCPLPMSERLVINANFPENYGDQSSSVLTPTWNDPLGQAVYQQDTLYTPPSPTGRLSMSLERLNLSPPSPNLSPLHLGEEISPEEDPYNVFLSAITNLFPRTSPALDDQDVNNKATSSPGSGTSSSRTSHLPTLSIDTHFSLSNIPPSPQSSTYSDCYDTWQNHASSPYSSPSPSSVNSPCSTYSELAGALGEPSRSDTSFEEYENGYPSPPTPGTDRRMSHESHALLAPPDFLSPDSWPTLRRSASHVSLPTGADLAHSDRGRGTRRAPKSTPGSRRASPYPSGEDINRGPPSVSHPSHSARSFSTHKVCKSEEFPHLLPSPGLLSAHTGGPLHRRHSEACVRPQVCCDPPITGDFGRRSVDRILHLRPKDEGDPQSPMMQPPQEHCPSLEHFQLGRMATPGTPAPRWNSAEEGKGPYSPVDGLGMSQGGTNRTYESDLAASPHFKRVVTSDATLAASQGRRKNAAKYTCPICDYKLTAKHNLERHIRAHKGEKPFVCLCGQSFTNKWDRKRHQRKSKKSLCKIAQC